MGILKFLEYLMYKIENDMETEPERWTEATKQMKVKEHRCSTSSTTLHCTLSKQAQASTGKQGSIFLKLSSPCTGQVPGSRADQARRLGGEQGRLDLQEKLQVQKSRGTVFEAA